jgi:Outer membrane protein beta-barrel domain
LNKIEVENMKPTTRAATLALALLAVPSLAHAQNLQVQGFGGVTVRGLSSAQTFGGNIAVPVGSHVQVIAEGGRMDDIMSPTLATLLDFAPVDLRLRAYYGEAGVRILGSSDRPVRPYVEATAGLARLRTGFSGAGSRPDAIINAGLEFLDTTRPMLGAGTGVMIQGGPVVVDLGYRFNKISTGNAIQSALTGGDFGVHQFRFGLGFRF